MMVFRAAPRLLLGLLLGGGLLVGCDAGGVERDGGGDRSNFNLSNCTIPTGQLADGGVPRNGIPSLNGYTTGDDRLVEPGSEDAGYLADGDRVIGLLFEDQPLAVPHNILWHHEIINIDDFAGRTFAVTLCPLTGSTLAFDRSTVDGAEFGVSGLLFNNNLLMFDRGEDESLWPQMSRGARCGADVGTDLNQLPVTGMTWEHWKELHPDTKVVSSETGHSRDYTARGYPYGNYNAPDNERLLFDTPIDGRRPPKERVLGLPVENGGLAIPFGELDDGSAARAVEVTVGGREVVVFWNQDARGAMAYRPRLDGQSLSFSVTGEGRFVDDQTGRTWTLDGRALDGSARLDPVETAYMSFWFAWPVFQPETALWTDQG
ncbi:DUF3179 domain-containing protein [Salinibacter altiplanensis]|uniref:DUF3179 domain-containing protein n=1 Tax=Salinibacter altiplanensis TaxID=1803181 RepID=UPI000C9ED793|nr:DUF3179 domain-containing protein [Salinibacter altiplanensis]